jgi:hypothetical protein
LPKKKKQLTVNIDVTLISILLMWDSGQLACISINLTGPEINDHVSFQ